MRFLLNVGIICLLTVLSFNGCTTAIDKIEPVKVGTSGLTEDEQNEILYSMLNGTHYLGTPEKSYYECTGRRPCSVRLSMYFYMENGNLILSDQSKCSLSDVKVPSKCLSGSSYQDYINFSRIVDKQKAEFEQKLPLLMNEYANAKAPITDWLNSAKSKKAQFVFENKNSFGLSDVIVNKMLQKAIYESVPLERLTPVQVFMQYKNSNKSLDSFLNDYVIGSYRPHDKLSIGHYSIISSKYSEGTVIKVRVKDLDSPLGLKHTATSYLFLPDKYTIKDKNISALFERVGGYYNVTITNLTNDYVEIDALSYYFDNNARNEFTIRNKSIPPQGKNDSYDVKVKIEETDFTKGKISNGQEKVSFGGAVNYTLKNKTIKNTLLEKTDIKVGDFENNLYKN